MQGLVLFVPVFLYVLIMIGVEVFVYISCWDM